MNTRKLQYNTMFSGIIGQDYNMLRLICPAATEMSRLVGVAVGAYPETIEPLRVVELGGGTGITTLSILAAKDTLHVLSIDNEPVIQEQAKKHLQKWVNDGRLVFLR